MAQLIARSVWDREVEGLSPFTPTIEIRPSSRWSYFYVEIEPKPSTSEGEGENRQWRFARRLSDGSYDSNREIAGSRDVTESFHPDQIK